MSAPAPPPPDGALGLHRMTLVQFASALALRQMAEAELAPATRLAMEAIAARIVHQLRKAGKLSYFGPVADSPGFAGALASTLNDLRLARIDSKQIESQDLSRLLKLYEQELASRKLADLRTMLDLAANTAANDAHPLLDLPLALLDPPVHSPTHEALIAAIAKRAPSVIALARPGDTGPLERALSRQSEAAAGDGNSDALSRLRSHLFDPGRPPATDYDASIDLFASPGEALESVEIARRIRRFADDGIAFDRIAILLRNPERYQPLVEEALRRAGIPGYFSRGSARPDPAGRAFLALLHCAAEDCLASRFAEYLSLGQTPPTDATGAPRDTEPEWAPPDDDMFSSAAAEPALEPDDAVQTIATPIAWERLLVDAAVIGGRDRWFRRLRGLHNEFQLQLSALRQEEDAERDRILRQLDRLTNLERFALPLIEQLSNLPKSAAWGEWLDVLARLAARALRRPESVHAVLNELKPMADIGPVELDEVTAVLSERLRILRTEPPRRRYGFVFVGSIEESRGRVFDVVFLPGLAEGLFPQRAFEDPLLLDERRREISTDLETRADRAANERLLLRTAIAAAARCFVASYPSMDLGQGRPRVPSFYALEIARAIEGRVPPLRSFEARASSNAKARMAWPAPQDPAQAIDDTEFDLAWFAANRGRPAGAAYLTRVNPHLARSLRARYNRWEKRAWNEADGLVNPDADLRAALSKRRLSQVSYSPSALQQFAACPYRFLLYGIHQLRERQEPAAPEQIDPLTRGALFHHAQFQFLREWQADPTVDFGLHLLRLDEIVNRVAEEYAEKLAPAIQRVWDAEIEEIRTDLRAWLRIWNEELADWEPIHFEFAFGAPRLRDADHDPSSIAEPVALAGDALVRGSIDLVERHRRPQYPPRHGSQDRPAAGARSRHRRRRQRDAAHPVRIGRGKSPEHPGRGRPAVLLHAARNIQVHPNRSSRDRIAISSRERCRSSTTQWSEASSPRPPPAMPANSATTPPSAVPTSRSAPSDGRMRRRSTCSSS